MLKGRPRVVDLFAGAGLLSYAFQKEGFEVIRAVEINRLAAATYAANLSAHVEIGDVTRAQPRGRCEVLVAGPPCQGFSTLGRRDPRDPRNRLSLHVVKWAWAMKPKVVVIENVAAFLTSPVWKTLARRLNALGYAVSAHVLNAFDFGAPQLRMRSFTIASKRPIDAPRSVVRGQRTVRDAFEGLSLDPDGKNHHYAPAPSQIALKRMRVIPPGGDKRDVMRHRPELAPPSWWTLNRVEITDVWGRMHWDRPSNTLRTALQNASKGRYIHPEQNRVISLREAARLQTIPDSWHFEGEPYPIARQIGNSVPPVLGRAIARTVRTALE